MHSDDNATVSTSVFISMTLRYWRVISCCKVALYTGRCCLLVSPWSIQGLFFSCCWFWHKKQQNEIECKHKIKWQVNVGILGNRFVVPSRLNVVPSRPIIVPSRLIFVVFLIVCLQLWVIWRNNKTKWAQTQNRDGKTLYSYLEIVMLFLQNNCCSFQT